MIKLTNIGILEVWISENRATSPNKTEYFGRGTHRTGTIKQKSDLSGVRLNKI